MNDQERKSFNLKAASLIKSLGISIPVKENSYNLLRDEYGFVGFADYYIQNCWDESELVNKADVIIYKQLLEIDTELGTNQSEQLWNCVYNSIRIDLVKV